MARGVWAVPASWFRRRGAGRGRPVRAECAQTAMSGLPQMGQSVLPTASANKHVFPNRPHKAPIAAGAWLHPIIAAAPAATAPAWPPFRMLAPKTPPPLLPPARHAERKSFAALLAAQLEMARPGTPHAPVLAALLELQRVWAAQLLWLLAEAQWLLLDSPACAGLVPCAWVGTCSGTLIVRFQPGDKNRSVWRRDAPFIV